MAGAPPRDGSPLGRLGVRMTTGGGPSDNSSCQHLHDAGSRIQRWAGAPDVIKMPVPETHGVDGRSGRTCDRRADELRRRSGTGADCAAAGVADGAITLGLLLPDDGRTESVYRTFRCSVDAQLGLENSRGGVSGREFRYQRENDGSDPNLNLRMAQELVEHDDAFDII